MRVLELNASILFGVLFITMFKKHIIAAILASAFLIGGYAVAQPRKQMFPPNSIRIWPPPGA